MPKSLDSANSDSGVIHPPGWDRKQVRDRVQEACQWAKLYLHPTRVTDIHNTKLQQIFGARGSSIGQYLRGALLIQVPKSHQVGVKSTSYYLNKDNLTLLQSLLVSFSPLQVSGVIQRAGVKKVDSSGSKVPSPDNGVIHRGYVYTDKSHRLWHEHQRIRRGEKDEFFTNLGLPFNYDIVSAAPTILVQLAQQAGLRTKNLVAVMTYLTAPKKFRSYVMRLTGLNYDDAKTLLTSLFNGARLQATPFCSAFNLLDRDKVRMAALQNDVNVQLLVKNISAVWNVLRTSTKLPLRTGGQKWSLYFQYERAILDIAVKYFDELDIDYFLEHDGYRTSTVINIAELERRVQAELNLKITLEQK